MALSVVIREDKSNKVKGPTKLRLEALTTQSTSTPTTAKSTIQTDHQSRQVMKRMETAIWFKISTFEDVQSYSSPLRWNHQTITSTTATDIEPYLGCDTCSINGSFSFMPLSKSSSETLSSSLSPIVLSPSPKVGLKNPS